MNHCPRCGQQIERWESRGAREAGFCGCQPCGPVVNRPAASLRRKNVVQEKPVALPGIGPELARVLERLGYADARAICDKTDAELLALPGLGEVRVARLRAWCEAQQDQTEEVMNDESSE